ncbi:MAG: hypothetical protein LKG24_01085 [Lacticaseibacillus songhuajiangensis]|jgi:hypothetical protein|nr:hypothetical protein [Lacticaseibacillus songhuajiangensis]
MPMLNRPVHNQFSNFSKSLICDARDSTRLQYYQSNLNLIADSNTQTETVIWAFYHNSIHPELTHVIVGQLNSNLDIHTLSAALNSITSTTQKSQPDSKGIIIDPHTQDSLLSAALVASGFHKFRTCYTCTWSNAQVVNVAREAHSKAVSSGQTYKLLSIADLTAAERQRLLERQYTDYKAAHLDNPVRSFDDHLQAWSKLVFDGTEAVNVPAVLLDQQAKRIMAYIISYLDEDELLLAYFGEQKAGLLETQILPDLLSVVATRHWQLSGELDDTNPLAMRIMHLLPAAKEEVDTLPAYKLDFAENEHE